MEKELESIESNGETIESPEKWLGMAQEIYDQAKDAGIDGYEFGKHRIAAEDGKILISLKHGAPTDGEVEFTPEEFAHALAGGDYDEELEGMGYKI